jgi:NAD(P)-dependent dehydrogenase (short-subunit alcohol dehydrogenase family)
MEQLRFDGQVAVVTGAGRGVGRGHALLLASRGASVVVADLGGGLDGQGSSTQPADDVVSEIEAAGGTAVACQASVADESGAAAIVAAALDTFGRIDVVVNNAGIADPDWFEDLSMDRFRRMVEVQFLGTVYVTAAAWPHLVEQRYGRIVNTTSEAALGVVPKATSYGASKGGVLSFTRELALEGQRHGIRVNAVAPRAQTRLSGPAVMAKTYDMPEESFKQGTMDRFAPELVAPAVGYLAHDSCQLNGEVLISGGGQVMRVAFVVGEGYTKDAMTPEDISANLDKVMDLTAARPISVGTVMSDETRAAAAKAATD